jgi:hypothetical protein
LANPWPGEEVAASEEADGAPVVQTAQELVRFTTRASGAYLVRRADQIGQPLPEFEVASPAPGPRQAFGRRLGIERLF